ncbi:MAG: permease prefix domain 1-containing protein, partial [Candidatus Nanopelagicales bacterium]
MATLTQRYVDVAVSGVPQSQRDDVAAELRASLADAVDDLTAQGVQPDEAEVRALTDLGDPAALAERFGGRPRHLIGPAYFGHYVKLLRTLLFVVLPIVGVASLIAQALTGASPIEGVLSALGVVFQVGVQIAFWVTVVFAVLERSHTPMPTRAWTLDDLPEVVNRRIGLGETVFGISVLTVLMWAIIWQRDHWLVTVDGVLVPVLNPAAWSPWIALLL